MIKVIKSDVDYQAALAEIEHLIDRDPDEGTPERDQLELLTVLVKEYESRKFHFDLPDPIEAILFRMEQQKLSSRDLGPYIGSRSKISEVLSRKRPLTLSMIRALHSGLGIPASVLLQARDTSELQESSIEWSRFPLREMISRGWIKTDPSSLRDRAEDLLRPFFAPVGLDLANLALHLKTDHIRSARSMDKHSLMAWTTRIITRAKESSSHADFDAKTVKLSFLREVAKLSWFDSGPLLAKEFLSKHGIPVIIEPHLPRTYLDGAAILILIERPIIGLTLRHDRIDNFWFCLMHELAHIALHWGKEIKQFYDDLDLEIQNDQKEKEADDLASEALIPREEWERSPASRLRSPEAAQHLANRLHIHPAIVAGRMRFAFKSFRLLNHLVGHGQVRKHFPSPDWGE